MHAAQPSLAAIAERSSAGTEPPAARSTAEVRTLLAELERALHAADAAALSRRQLAVLRALYCGRK